MEVKKIIYIITHPFVRFYWKICKPKTFGSRSLVLHQNKILLVKNINVKYWSFPGGRINLKESPEQCIKRELQEEVNIFNVKIEYKLGEYFSDWEGKRDTIHIFVINLDNKNFEKQWELAAAQWFELDNLPEDISPACQRRINEYKEGKRNLKLIW